MIVIDASVVIKLFNAEDDSDIARNAIDSLAEQGRAIGAPSLVLYETLGAALHYGVPFQIPLRLFDDLISAGFRLVDPTADELSIAEKIATSGTKQSGRPSLQDAIYHSIAIARGGVFITADRKHFERASGFGRVSMLADWRSA